MKSRPSLFRRATLSIGTGLLVFQVLSIAAIAAYVLMPLEEQSANDFAALLALSARTWVELPPETRQAFATELASNHALELREAVEAAGGETQHHHMYMQYLRVEPSRSRATGGSGLGLAIARQLAETHGWVLAMKPRVGGGSSFWLALPDAARTGTATAS